MFGDGRTSGVILSGCAAAGPTTFPPALLFLLPPPLLRLGVGEDCNGGSALVADANAADAGRSVHLAGVIAPDDDEASPSRRDFVLLGVAAEA